MKILQLLKTSTGADWAFRQMEELVKRGEDVYVAMPRGGKLISKYIDAGIKIYYINFSINSFIQSCSHLRRIVKEINPDIVHSHFVITTLIMRLVLRGDNRPRIFQVPGPLHLENSLFRNLELLSSQQNDYWVGSCLWTNDRYRKSGVSDDKIFLSYYGSDIHSKDSYTPNKLKKELLGLAKDDILVGIVAYMYKPKRYLGQSRGIKGHEDLIDAIAILKDKYPNLYCVCIGGAWDGATEYENSIIKYAEKKAKGRIFFTGTITNVGELYNDLFCVIHPSHSENLGGAAESLMLGIPTISSNVGGFPDIVIHNETGLLVPPKSPGSIADALDSILRGDCNIERMVENGKKRTCELMDIRNTSRSMLDIYKKILHV